MTQLVIMLASGSRIEPTKAQQKQIEAILFTETTEAPIRAEVVERTIFRRKKRMNPYQPWTQEQDQAYRNFLNARLGQKITTTDLKEFARSIERSYSAVNSRFYALYVKKFNAGAYQ